MTSPYPEDARELVNWLETPPTGDLSLHIAAVLRRVAEERDQARRERDALDGSIEDALQEIESLRAGDHLEWSDYSRLHDMLNAARSGTGEEEAGCSP